MNFIFEPSLVLYLPLYGLDGASFMSRDAYGHLGTVTGALWRPDGRFFDGVDDKITIPHSAGLNVDDAITVELWVKPDDLTGSNGIISKLYGTAPYWGMWFSGGNLRWEVKDATTADNTTTGGSLFSVDNWYHIVATQVAKDAKIFVNSIVEKEETLTESMSETNNSSDLELGRLPGGFNLGGIIGEARVYTRGLTTQEIQHNYLATKWRYQ